MSSLKAILCWSELDFWLQLILVKCKAVCEFLMLQNVFYMNKNCTYPIRFTHFWLDQIKKSDAHILKQFFHFQLSFSKWMSVGTFNDYNHIYIYKNENFEKKVRKLISNVNNVVASSTSYLDNFSRNYTGWVWKSITVWVIFYKKLILYFEEVSNEQLL